MNTKNNQKVRLSEKLGLFMVYAGNIPLMTLLSAYFLIYYTTVVGLDPMGLSTLFLISKVVDGVSDPVMGFIMDRFPVTKRGKFRPMLVLVCIRSHGYLPVISAARLHFQAEPCSPAVQIRLSGIADRFLKGCILRHNNPGPLLLFSPTVLYLP